MYTSNASSDIFNEKPRLFVDMDGTLAEWRNISINVSINCEEDKFKVVDMINNILYQNGYYASLKPHTNVVDAIKKIIQDNEIEVFVCSCVLPDKKQFDNTTVSPVAQKNAWLDKYLPEIDTQHRIFVPDGEDKKKYIPGGIRPTDFLFDDYTEKLKLFCTKDNQQSLTIPKNGIKLLNNVNSKHGSWGGSCINYLNTAEVIKHSLKQIILENIRVRDENPPKQREPFPYAEHNFEEEAKEAGFEI